jgi:hypothetical protein
MASNSVRRLLVSSFSAATGLAASASVSHTSASPSSSSSSSTSTMPPGVSEWAFPSPYDHGLPPGRFAAVEHLRKPGVAHWDLRGLVDLWRNSKDETWPWVWCDRNPVGPHHVFINVNARTLEQVTKVCADDRRNNLTVVVRSMDDLTRYNLTPSDLWAHRCAIIEVPLQEIDTENCILMLADERIILYDYCYLS